MAACAIVVLLASRHTRESRWHDPSDNVGAKVPAAPSTFATVPAVAILVSATYLVPNAVEAAVVAAVASGLSAATGLSATLAAVVMLTAAVPGFAAPVINGPRSTGVVARVAAFFHPVVVNGLRAEGARLLRAHALLDLAAACLVAAAGGVTQAGSRLGGSCVAAALVMAVSASALTAYYALAQPFRARLEVGVSTVQASALAVLCWMTVAAVASEGAIVTPATLDLVGNAAEILTFAAPLVLLAGEVWLRYCSRARASPTACDAAAVEGCCSQALQDTGPSAQPLLAVPMVHQRHSPSRDSPISRGPEEPPTRHRNPLAKDA
jgi:hypothetical protein